VGPQRVQQAPSCRIGEGLEHFVHVHSLNICKQTLA
jgi:hypothetical protein